MEARIKYAKWKAADISRAFREGRKPTPGPAGAEDDPMLIDGATTPTSTVAGFDLPAPPDNGLGTPTSTNPPTLNRSSPSPTMDVGDIQRANSNFIPISSPPSVPADKEVTPGMWSTAATPGVVTPEDAGQSVSWQPNASSSGHARTGSTGSTLSATSKTLASSGSYHQSPPPSATPSSPMAISSPPPPAPIVPAAAPHQPPPAAVQLTPQVIAKAQKHCRFAISALDYEDADTARKQLREALAVLGG